MSEKQRTAHIYNVERGSYTEFYVAAEGQKLLLCSFLVTILGERADIEEEFIDLVIRAGAHALRQRGINVDVAEATWNLIRRGREDN